MSYLEKVRACARYRPENYLPFRISGEQVGQVRLGFLPQLARFEDTFCCAEDGLNLADNLHRFEQRTEAVGRVLEGLREEGLVPGWRDEASPVTNSFGSPPFFDMERAAVPLFGVRGYGVHVNGFVGDGGDMRMWIGRRSMSKPTGPGKLDQMVAGGQPSGMSLRENMLKESAEEANIPRSLAEEAVSVGAISYLTERPEGLRHDVLFNFDLHLPENFEPVNTDDEVDAFYLWPMDQIMEVIRETDDFKFNSALVIIDFLVRRGFIYPDDPDYAAIVTGLHR